MTRLIIPAAGLGSRMNMPNNQSKELLINPYTNEPLIEYSLDLADHFGISPLVITRIEKQDLIQYCAVRGIETMIIGVKGEWANTVLQSKAWWDDDNILVLPDTIFNDEYETIKNIKNGLNLGNNAVFALHRVRDVSNWGYINNYEITEKPIGNISVGFAWGLIGFKKTYGEKLFSALQTKNNPLQLENCGFTYLQSFNDLTRTGKIG